ncbi:hypothetical protein HFN86_09105 [Rhizobium laguerreae]|uniref:hypothetical protein n=1 Tax=Rhizobium laguerreae TaxID=1076926 RepID=UPI001C90F3A7|nr:hypothetical protein [Rhizobium laguerreae]MBY3420368.1 hypothetical protein [Rhizobium laguerreae]
MKKKAATVTLMTIIVWCLTCVPSLAGSFVLRDIKLAPSSPIVLRTPYAGTIGKLAQTGRLYLKPPAFPPGLFVSPRVTAYTMDYASIVRVPINIYRQEALKELLRQNSPVLLRSSEDVVQFQSGFRANLYQSLTTLLSFQQKTRSDDHPFWRDFELHAPELATLLQIASQSFDNFRLPGSPLAFDQLGEIDAAYSEGTSISQFTQALIDTVRSVARKDFTDKAILLALREAAFWDLSQNDAFQHLYYVANYDSPFDLSPPNSSDLIDTQKHRVSFVVRRETGGIEADLQAPDRGLVPKADGARKPDLVDGLSKFSAYWKMKASNGFFDYNDQVFLLTLIAPLRAEKDLTDIKATHKVEYGNFADFQKFVTAAHTSVDLYEKYSFPIDEVSGLVDWPVAPEIEGMKYLASRLADEADQANQFLLYRHSVAAVIRCAYTGCARPTTGPAGTNLNILLQSVTRSLRPGMPSQELPSLLANTADEMTVVEQMRSLRQKGEVRDSVAAWLVNELRSPIAYDGRFVHAAEAPSVVYYHPVGGVPNGAGDRADDRLVFSAVIGGLEIATDRTYWTLKKVGDKRSDRWGVARRLTGTAYGYLARTRLAYDLALTSLQPDAVASAFLNHVLSETGMRHQLALESRAMRDSIIGETVSTEAAIAGRQSGQFFLHDDGVVENVLNHKEGDYLEAGADLLVYRPIFSYEFYWKDAPSGRGASPVDGAKVSGTLTCSGQFFGSMHANEAFETAKTVERSLSGLLDTNHTHEFPAEITFRNVEQNPTLPALWMLEITVQEDDRFVPVTGLAPDHKAAELQYQNKALFKQNAARIVSTLERQNCGIGFDLQASE